MLSHSKEAIFMADVEVYTIQEICEMFDIDYERQKSTIHQQIKSKRWIFPTIQVGKRFVVSKPLVDKTLRTGKVPNLLGIGRPTRWYQGEYKEWNFRVSIPMHEAFKVVCENENRKLKELGEPPISLGDYRRLAMQEFIERRPVKGG
jgi:predicted DNA-binding transcriptional regulator AlpA